MELRHLRYFVALVEEASFTRAARKMHVTQSTLSHQIRQLEDEVGQALFDRIGKRVVITQAGEALLQHATRALREIDEGLRLMRGSGDPQTGTLRVGATYTFNVRVIPECLAAFLQTHPGMRVVSREMFGKDIVPLVESGELDLGITYDPQRDDQLNFEPLYIEEMVLAIPGTHSFTGRKRARLIELHQLRMILPTPETSTRRIIDAALASVGAEPVVVAEIDSLAATLELVRRSELGAIVSRLAVPDARGLHLLALESPNVLRTPGIVTRIGCLSSPALHAFIAILRRTVLQHQHI